MSRLPPRRTGLKRGTARTGLQRGGGKRLTRTQRAKRHAKNPPLYSIEYARYKSDIINNDLGRLHSRHLGDALKTTQKMLKKGYLQIRLTREK